MSAKTVHQWWEENQRGFELYFEQVSVVWDAATKAAEDKLKSPNTTKATISQLYAQWHKETKDVKGLETIGKFIAWVEKQYTFVNVG